jgi:hypothetical protein
MLRYMACLSTSRVYHFTSILHMHRICSIYRLFNDENQVTLRSNPNQYTGWDQAQADSQLISKLPLGSYERYHQYNLRHTVCITTTHIKIPICHHQPLTFGQLVCSSWPWWILHFKGGTCPYYYESRSRLCIIYVGVGSGNCFLLAMLPSHDLLASPIITDNTDIHLSVIIHASPSCNDILRKQTSQLCCFL